MSSQNWEYGIIGRDGGHIDISTTEKGAKRMATNRGYKQVTRRHIHSWAVEVVATKVNGKWKKGDINDY